MYLLMESLHVLAVVRFLGNIITGLFWKAHGDRTGDPGIMAHRLDGTIRSDRWFTLPGVLLIVLFGVAEAMTGGIPIVGRAGSRSRSCCSWSRGWRSWAR